MIQVKKKLSIALLLTASLVLTACSQLLGDKTSRPIPLKPLKAVVTQLKTTTNWQVKSGSTMGENKIHPLIKDKAVFIAGGSTASAWSKNNGKLIWKTVIGETISAGVNGSLDNTKQIFIGTSNGNAIALNASTGKIQWIERLNSEILAISPSNNGRVAFRTIDGKLHGLSSSTGELIWQQSQRTPTLTLMGASVPIVVGPYVIAGFDNGKVAAYHLQTGETAWEVTLTLPRGRTELERIIDVDGKLKPIGTALFAASMNGSMNGIILRDGKVAWSKRFSSSTGANANPQGLYSSDSKGNIWKMDPQTGNPMWKMDDLLRYEPTLPVLVGSSNLVVADKKGNLHWINSTTGKFMARVSGDPSGYSVEPEVDGNSIYAIGKSGLLSKISTQ